MRSSVMFCSGTGTGGGTGAGTTTRGLSEITTQLLRRFVYRSEFPEGTYGQEKSFRTFSGWRPLVLGFLTASRSPACPCGSALGPVAPSITPKFGKAPSSGGEHAISTKRPFFGSKKVATMSEIWLRVRDTTSCPLVIHFCTKKAPLVGFGRLKLFTCLLF